MRRGTAPLAKNHQRIEKLISKKLALRLAKGERRQRADNILIAHGAAEIAFHAPGRKQDRRGHAGATRDLGELRLPLLGQCLALRDTPLRDRRAEIGGKWSLEFALPTGGAANARIGRQIPKDRDECRPVDATRGRLRKERIDEATKTLQIRAGKRRRFVLIRRWRCDSRLRSERARFERCGAGEPDA